MPVTPRPSIRRLQALDRQLGPALAAVVVLPRLVRRGARRLARAAERLWPGALRPENRRPGVLRPFRPARRVLLIKFWGLGSLQLLGPATRALRERHPGASLELLTLAANSEFATALGIVDEVHQLDLEGAGVGGALRRLVALTWRLRRRGFDAVYDFEFLTHTSALVGALAAPRQLVGFSSARASRGGLHDETLPFDEERHVAASFRDLAAGHVVAHFDPEEVTPPRLAARDVAAVGAFLVERLAPGQRPLAVLNPNAGELAPERRWPPERFGALARALVLDGFDVAVIGAADPGEVACAAAVVAAASLIDLPGAAHGRSIDLAGGLSLGELCALLARAALVVSNDSGPMHIAAALGAPTLGLFGPETPKRYGPVGARAVALWDPPPCGPCINVHDNKLADCVFGRAECMLRLSVARVHEVARTLHRRSVERERQHAAGSTFGATADRERCP